MSTDEEFSFIAAQLEWLETHLRRPEVAQEGGRMESALNALACARAVIVELAQIGVTAKPPAGAPISPA